MFLFLILFLLTAVLLHAIDAFALQENGINKGKIIGIMQDTTGSKRPSKYGEDMVGGSLQNVHDKMMITTTHQYIRHVDDRRNDMFELEDVATSDNWVGPAASTSALNIYSITSDSLGVNLAAGTNSAGIYYSRNGGDTWLLSGGAPTTSGGVWNSMASSSTGQFVVTGAQVAPGQIWTSTDYGTSFTMRETFGSSQFPTIGSLAMTPDGSKVIVGIYGLGVEMYSFDTSSTATAGVLTQIGSTITTGGSSTNAVSTDASFVFLTFAASNGDGVYFSQNRGVSWTQSLTNTPTGMSIYGIASSCSGQTMVAAVSGCKIYLSYDYGQSWQTSASSIAGWYGVAVSDDGGTMYGGAVNTGTGNTVQGIFKSSAATVPPTAFPTSRPSSQPAISASTSSLSHGAVAGIAIAVSSFVILVIFAFYKYILNGSSHLKMSAKDTTANFDTSSSSSSNSRAPTSNPMMSTSAGSSKNDINAGL